MVPTRILPGLSQPAFLCVPRIYVVPSSTSTNAFAGRWIDAARPWSDIAADVDHLLLPHERCCVPQREWAIVDWEGFGPWSPDEHEPLETISEVACGIVECGPAFAHWVSNTDMSRPDLVDRFHDDFLGEWADIEQFASQVVADATDNLGFVPSWLAPFVQVDLIEIAQYLTKDLLVIDGDHTVFIYSR